LQKVFRLPAVQDVTGKSRSEIYEDIARGAFPPPFKLSEGGRAVAWLESDLVEWQRARIAERDARLAEAECETRVVERAAKEASRAVEPVS
jgi:prophage regulatory protein